MARVMVGMSGGVDSSVTAAAQAGGTNDVIGVTLNVWPDLPNMPEFSARTRAAALGRVEDGGASPTTGHPVLRLNFKEVFEERVIKDFVQTYASGRTPNRASSATSSSSSTRWLVKARQLGAQYVGRATTRDRARHAQSTAQGG